MKHTGILIKFFTLTLVVLGSSCANGENPPSDPQEALLVEVTGSEVRDFWTNDFGREKRHGGHSVLVPEEKAEGMLLAIRKRLQTGYVAFVGTTRNLDDPNAKGAEIVVAPGKDQFDILRLSATDGINYDLSTDKIVARLRAWDSQFGIDIWQAETDTVQMKLKSLPTNIESFSKELYEFCPDIVDQGVGDLDSLERGIVKERAIYLWWD